MKKQKIIDLPEVYKMTELGPLPEEWEFVRLGDVADLIMGQSPPGATYNPRGEGFPFLQGKAEFGDIHPRHVKFTTDPKKIAPKGSILMSVRAPVGDVNIADIDYCIGRGLSSISLIDGNNKFLFFTLTLLKSSIEKEGTGSTFKAINKSKLEDIKIPLPPLPEQNKIVAVLSSVQEAKEKTEAIIKVTKELKKSLMKYLFTYGSVPVEEAENVKLKETEIGEMPEEWEVKPSNKIFYRITDGTHDTPKKLSKGIPLIKSKQIKNGKIDKNEIDYYISKEDYKLVNKRSKVDKYDLLFSMIGTLGEVALISEKPDFAIKNVGLFKTNKDYNLAIYCYYWLQSEFVKNYIEKTASGTSQKYITLAKLRNFPILFPPLTIRKKIASILSAVDEKIQAEEDKKKALEDLFKTLLHDLMTAKIRLNHLEVRV